MSVRKTKQFSKDTAKQYQDLSASMIESFERASKQILSTQRSMTAELKKMQGKEEEAKKPFEVLKEAGVSAMNAISQKATLVTKNLQQISKMDMDAPPLVQNLFYSFMGLEKEMNPILQDFKTSFQGVFGFLKISSARAAFRMIQSFQSVKEHLDLQMDAKKIYFKAVIAPFFVQTAKISKAIAQISVKPITIFFKAVDLTASAIASISKGIHSLLKNIKFDKMLTDGIGFALNSAFDWERQGMSINHIMASSQPGKSAGTVQNEADDYLRMLDSNISNSPFDPDDMLKAGASALKMSAGDSTQAMTMLNLAKDMVAVNPAKSLEDALGALNELKIGKSGMKVAYDIKDYGFEVDPNQLAGANGDWSKIKGQQGIGLTEMFSGGSDKLGATAGGMVTVIKNKFKSGLAGMGNEFIKNLAPELKKLTPFMGNMVDFMTNFGTTAAKAIPVVISHLKRFIDWITPLIQPVIAIIQQVVEQAVQFITPLLPPIMTLFQSVFGWIQENMPIFQEAIGAVFDFLQPVIYTVLDTFNSLWQTWQEAWPIIQDILSTAWGIFEPIFNGIVDVFRLVVFVFNQSFRPMLETLWTLLEPIMDGISKIVNWVGDKFGNLIDWMIGGDPPDSPGNPAKPHAAGLHTVPRDNYPALLHKNEAVLTAQEANQYRNGRGGSHGITINLNHPVARDEADFTKWAQVLRAELEGAAINMA
ncbi:hypothetical protein MH117_22180 [Paenibacillus sp. ACRRX]|uniref:phage tail protein n=1 Tax=Paenibacillus sp. ACRRX TaxID=2918206 RepID=UPI001EF59151|nr:hypothetical protein [Paenibacillus sp. ACRRX]MCG7410126.1 hypothetical protein [Paenibacillus sp. ACRRX]